MTGSGSFAPGEVIFFGEHSVVYGRLGLACSIGLGIRTAAVRRSDGRLALHSHLGEYSGRWTGTALETETSCPELLPLAELAQLFFKSAERFVPLDVRIDSELPEQSGLASSAAVSSALIDLLARETDVTLSASERVDWVYRGEIAIQKRGSVIGSATTALGGWIAVRDGKWERPDLPFTARLAVIDTQERCPTEITTRIVRDRLKSDPKSTEAAFDRMDAVARAGLAAAARSDWKEMGRQMTENQGWLKFLGVSTDRIERCLAAVSPHVLGAKITGAGGGGCLVCLLDPAVDAKTMSALGTAASASGCRVLPTGLTPALTSGVTGGAS